MVSDRISRFRKNAFYFTYEMASFGWVEMMFGRNSKIKDKAVDIYQKMSCGF